MTFGVLVKRSLAYHWRTNLGVLLGSAVTTAILSGALIVGDSVSVTLHEMALGRLGQTQLALATHDRLFRSELADALQKELEAPAAPVLQLPGMASLPDGSARAPRIQIQGVDRRFWEIGGGTFSLDDQARDAVALNERLARKLGVKVNDPIVLRLDKPDRLSRDAPLSPDADHAVKIPLIVRAILANHSFGNFSLKANQVPPFNAFIPLALLQKRLEEKRAKSDTPFPPHVNLLLLGGGPKVTPEAARKALKAHWRLADAALELRVVPNANQPELRTSRIFLDPPVEQAALDDAERTGAAGVIAYMVNELRVGKKTTPYSMVAGLEPRGRFTSVVSPGMKDDEIVVNSWLAEDLNCKPGDKLTLKYFILGPMRKTIEVEHAFTVRGVTPLEGVAADRELMPEFPGLSDTEHCRDWDPGFKIDLDLIRDKDEAYWNQYRGTPKAFITLKAGRERWTNRFGALTAVRFGPQTALAALEKGLLERVDPSELGLVFLPVRDQALQASVQGFDFGGLFIGFSFFLIVAALLLTALLFAFGVENRASEVGTLLALGIPVRQVRGLLLMEGGLLALAGAVVGVLCGLGYAGAMLYGLTTIWRDAVQTSSLEFHLKPATLGIGLFSGFIVALFSIWLVLRKQARRPARELLQGADMSDGVLREAAGGRGGSIRNRSLWIALGSALIALGIVFAVGARKDPTAAAAFFGAGSLLLIAGLALGAFLLQLLRHSKRTHRMTVGALGLRNAIRRPGRSLATLSLLACGSFLVIAVGANRQDPLQGADKPASGTGGTTLFGETSLPVVKDLNTATGRDEYALSEKNLTGVSFIPMRLREGDDASCLNLNRAQNPKLWGVDPARFEGRFTFSKLLDGMDAKRPWAALDALLAEDEIAAVGDENTVMWGLGMMGGVGGALDYRDEYGRPFKIRIVGTLATSILQGALIVSEQAFQKRFPSASGYRVFLIDTPKDRVDMAVAELNNGLEDQGLDLTPSARRLGDFMAVQNTYLSTFLILGGLGLLLGSVGLGVLVLRNVMERRRELALLRAVGFGKGALRWLVASEHGGLLVYGMLCGVISALIAVLPALRAPGAEVPYAGLAITAAGVMVSGLIWTWLAAVAALRGPLLQALREE